MQQLVIICFNIYNEPTNDPRLIYFIQFIKDKLGVNGKTFVISNGYYLNESFIQDLHFLGLDILWVSAYSDADYRYFTGIKVPETLQYYVRPHIPLDDRLDIYDSPLSGCVAPCGAPLGQICVRCNGDVILCCMDWKSTTVFGNLKEKNISDIIKEGKMQGVYDRLIKGDRYLDICSRCSVSFF